tara:strand:- start:10 stop:162 length:153 start_codon:yes stop_codon:yes gene_type:complete
VITNDINIFPIFIKKANTFSVFAFFIQALIKEVIKGLSTSQAGLGSLEAF